MGLETTDRRLNLAYTPNDVATYTRDTIRSRQELGQLGLDTGIASVDQWLTPLLPAELAIIMARPSNYKSGFMQAWARNIVEQIYARQQDNPDASPREVVFFCTWEMYVEELGFYDIANRTNLSAKEMWYGHLSDNDLRQVDAAAMVRAGTPIWLIGHSLHRRKEYDRVTLTTVRDTMLAVEETWGVRPAIIFLDYLQAIDAERGEDRRLQVMYNVDRAKDLGREMGCPVVLACQAGRDVDRREFRLPELGDGQETSRIEQAADKFLALWMPKTSYAEGHHLEEIGLQVTSDMLIVGLRKQRMGISGQMAFLSVNPVTNTILPYSDREKHHVPASDSLRQSRA